MKIPAIVQQFPNNDLGEDGNIVGGMRELLVPEHVPSDDYYLIKCDGKFFYYELKSAQEEAND